MAISDTRYISYPEAVLIHMELMRLVGEIRYGVFDRTLIESAQVTAWLDLRNKLRMVIMRNTPKSKSPC